MIAASPTTADWWMLIGILILLGILMVLSIAEMGLSRVSKPKAQALADSGARGGAALLALVTHPERWVNPLLLSVNVCQTVQATLTGVVAGRLFGPAGVAIGVVLNVVYKFVRGVNLVSQLILVLDLLVSSLDSIHLKILF
jgi:Mg2+/Co2+ transporter CorB